MAKDNSAVWHEIDPLTLTDEVKYAYDQYKAQYAAMKAARLTFETMLAAQAAPVEGKRVVFGYNFGKLSVAIVDDDRKPAKATPAKQSLADFIAAQASAGRRA